MDEVPHFRKADYPLHRVGAAVWDGHIFINLDPQAAPLEAQLGALPAKFRAVAHGGSPARPPHRLRRARELEADRPELQRVPALPEPAPGAQQAVALPERRERAAAADLHGRAHGSAARRRDACRWTARCPRAFLPGLSAEERRARLLLRDLSEHAAQPAPRLHDGAHAVAARAGPDDQHLRVALPSRRDARARASTRPMRSSSGT